MRARLRSRIALAQSGAAFPDFARAHPGYELKDQGFRSADLCRTVAASWICELKKTSLTHPLQIAAVAAGAGFGRVGITLCPGKCDPHAMSGEWERDLAVDLDAVRDW